MTTTMTTAIACSAVLGAMIFVLGANVTAHRARVGRAGGNQAPTDPADRLLIAQRAHGNASEYVPTIIALMLLVAWRDETASWLGLTLILGATVARLLHAVGMLGSPSLAKRNAVKEAGAAGTYLFGFALAAAAAATLL